MDNKEVLDKLYKAQLNALRIIEPNPDMSCRDAARMIRYAMSLQEISKENISLSSTDYWLSVLSYSESLISELSGILPNLLFSVDFEFEKMSNVISLSQAIGELTNYLEEKENLYKENSFEFTFDESDFSDLLPSS